MGHGPHSYKFFVLFYVLFVLCRSVYCLCVNMCSTTATGWQPSYSEIYHINIYRGHLTNNAQAGKTAEWSAYYSDWVQKLSRKMHKNRPDLLGDGPLILQDNERPHLGNAVTDLPSKYEWEVLPHAPYSTDMSPPEFDIFPKLKESMRGHRFSSLEEASAAVTQAIRRLNKSGILNGIANLPKRWDAVIEKQDYYVNKKKACIVYEMTLVAVSWDSVVGIATRYGLDGSGIESRWRARFSAPVHTGPGAHPASYTMGKGLFTGGKAAGPWH
jgi:hypothetical protein